MIGYIVVFSILVLFCLYPLFMIARLGIVNDDGRFTFSYLGDVLTDRIYLKIISFTLVQALISAIVTILAALPGAYLLSRYNFKGRSVILAASTVPFVLPPLILAVGFHGIFGSQGTLNQWIGGINGSLGTSFPEISLLYTREIIILAHVFFNFPIALRILHSRFEAIDMDLVRAARSMGAGWFRTLIKVILPQMRYSLLSSFSLIFTVCFLSLGVVLVIGGLNQTLEVEVMSLFKDGRSLAMHHAAALVMIGSLIVMIATFVYLWSSTREGSGSNVSLGTGTRTVGVKRPSVTASILFIFYIILIVLVIFGPLLSVIHQSLLEGPKGDEFFSTRWYGEVFSSQMDKTLSISPLGAIINSLLFGFLTMIVSVPLSFITAHAMDTKLFPGKRYLDMLLLFPLGASSIALGYGLVRAYSGDPLQLTGTWYIIVLVHSVIAYPLGARAVYSSLRSIPPDLIRAARSMGAGPVESYIKIKLPLLMPGILIAAVFAFAISLGELGATLMVSNDELMTMPVVLYRMIAGGGRELGAMNAFAVILMLITFLSFIAIEVLRKIFQRWGVER